MTRLSPQQIKLFEKWLQEQADFNALKVDNLRSDFKRTNDLRLYRELLLISSIINSIILVKSLLIQGNPNERS